MYQERMSSCYPEVIRAVEEFKAIVDSEYPEFEDLSANQEKVLNNAYLLTMDEDRLSEWEKILSLKPLAGSTVEDRRESVIGAIRGQGKLNTTVIEAIVSSFTGGITESWIIDSILYVKIYPPANNKSYIFDNVKNALASKVPAHLELNVFRNYATWGAIKSYAPTWGDVYEKFKTWNDVKFIISSSNDNVFEYIVDESGNSITNELNNKLFN